MKIQISLLALCLFIIFLTGCKINDPLLLESSACELPCWHGITPGETTEDEFESKLELIEGFSSYLIGDLGQAGIFEQELNYAGVFEDNILTESTIYRGNYWDTSLGSPVILLDQIISVVGEPDYYFVGQIGSGDAGSIEGFFVYPQNNMIIVARLQRFTSNSEKLYILPTGKTARIILVKPEEFGKKIVDLKQHHGMKIFTEDYPWEGYSNLPIEKEGIAFYLIFLSILTFYWIGFWKSILILFQNQERFLPGFSIYFGVLRQKWGEDDFYYHKKYAGYRKVVKIFSTVYLILFPFGFFLSGLYLVSIFRTMQQISYYLFVL